MKRIISGLAIGPLLLCACASQPRLQFSPIEKLAAESFQREVLASRGVASVFDPAGTDRDQGVVDPKPAHTPRPPYPPELRRQRLQGVVLLGGVIEKDGTVSNARVISTSTVPELDALSLTAFRGWTYRPATKAGEPVAVFLFTRVAYTIQ